MAILGIFADFSRYFLNGIVDLDEILHEASKWDDGSSDNFGAISDPLVGRGAKLIWKFLPCMTVRSSFIWGFSDWGLRRWTRYGGRIIRLHRSA